MTGAEHVPGSQDGRWNAARSHQPLPFLTDGNERVHHRRRVGHADVDEMTDPRGRRCLDGGADRDEID